MVIRSDQSVIVIAESNIVSAQSVIVSVQSIIRMAVSDIGNAKRFIRRLNLLLRALRA